MSRSIESIFNETELALFQRQTGFTFGKFYKAADGILLAADDQSGQVFIGNDLLRTNVHGFSSISTVCRNEGCLTLTFKNSPTKIIHASREDAEAFVAELGDITQTASLEDIGEETTPQPDKQPNTMEELQESLSNEELNEFYSRLVNTGRGEAIEYLVSKIGMNIKDASRYLDELEGQETIAESLPEPKYHRDGTMTGRAIFETIKRLKPGDRIHLEFKPLIGKLRVYDAEYRKIKIDSTSGVGNYFALNEQAKDFQTLMNDVAEDLFDYMDLYFHCDENDSEISCHLKRVTMLKIQNESTADEEAKQPSFCD